MLHASEGRVRGLRPLLVTAWLTLSLFSAASGNTSIHFQATGSLAADYDNDGSVGFIDFLTFTGGFGTTAGESDYDVRFDLNTNGIVDFDDFLLFADAFGTTSVPPQSTPDLALYVLDPGSGSIDIYNIKNHLAQEFLPFRSPSSMYVSEDHERIYVNEQFGLFIIGDDHTVLGSIPGTSTGEMTVGPDEQFAYAAEPANGTVRVIDLTAQTAVDTISVGTRPGRMAVTPNGRFLYVLNVNDISVVDLNSNAEVLRVDVDGNLSSIVIDVTGSRAYYSLSSRAAVGVLDLGTNAIVGEIQFEGEDANDMHLSQDGTRLLVNTTTALVEVDVTRNLVTRSLTLAAATSGLGVTPDGLFAYVGSLEPLIFEPGLAVVDLTAWRILGRIRGFVFPRDIMFRRTTFDFGETEAALLLP